MHSGFFVFAKIDCKKFAIVCSNYFGVSKENYKGISTLKFYPNTDDIYSSIEQQINIPLNSLDEFSLWASSHFKSKNQIVSSSEFFKIIFESRNKERFNCVFLFNRKPNEINKEFNLFKSLSGLTDYHKVDFLSLENPNEKVRSLLKVKSLPSISFIYHNKVADEGFKQQNIYNIEFMEIKKLIENVGNLIKF